MNPKRLARNTLVALAAALLLAGCSGDISEPWVSGDQATALQAERTRTDEQQKELRARLERYGDAYQ